MSRNEHGRLLIGGERVQRPDDLTRTGKVVDCRELFATVEWDDGERDKVDTLFHGLEILRRSPGSLTGYTYVPALSAPCT